MKKNQIIIMLGFLLIGMLLGYLFWGGSADSSSEGIADGREAKETIWVSPMHPHIRQNEPGQCPICGMDLVPLSQFEAGGGGSDPYVMEMSAEAVALSNVMTVRVGTGMGNAEIRMTGKIQPSEQRTHSIAANFSGRIEKLFVDFTGQEVQRGQKLLTIYSPELLSAQKELLEINKVKEAQPALYQAAREKLKLWRLTESQIDQIIQTGNPVNELDIYADASGVVIARNIAVGDFVSRGVVLFDIVDLREVWVLLDAYESDIAGIRKGDEVQFRVAAYPGKDYAGKVTFVDRLMNPQTRTIALRAEAKNPNFELKPEMFVQATLKPTNRGQQGILVPKSAVLWTGKRSVVYVQKGTADAPAFEMREITLGSRMGEDYMVLSGLEDGEEVVSNGVFAIDAAAQLSGKYSMMGRPENRQLDVSEDFLKRLTSTIQQYFDLKDALVKSDVALTKSEANEFNGQLAKFDKGSLDAASKTKWDDLERQMQKALSTIIGTEDLEKQRKDFEDLSALVTEAVEVFGLSEITVYRQYCPMAFKDQGAYWLSAEKEIRNPYFGDMMLTCGEVKQTFYPKAKN